jgi:hypothetical protein
VSELRKAIAAASACAGVIAAQYATNGTVQHWTTIVISVCGAALTYVVPNAPKGPTDYEPRHEISNVTVIPSQPPPAA